MTRVIATLLATSFAAAVGAAPVQCAHKPDPDLRREDAPDDALWGLAADFRAKGNESAAKETLRYLVEKYPTSRHAEAARSELGASAIADAGAIADGGGR